MQMANEVSEQDANRADMEKREREREQNHHFWKASKLSQKNSYKRQTKQLPGNDKEKDICVRAREREKKLIP